MSTPELSRLEAVLTELDDLLEEATPRLRSRKEWKQADRWRRELGEIGELTELEDRIREAEAQRDLLSLAASELAQEVAAEDRLKRIRLAEDEELLGQIERELKIYGIFIAAGFIVPPILLTFGPWLVLGAAAPLVGLLRMLRVTGRSSGRAWLILQDRVDQPKKLILFGHLLAGLSWLVTAAWLVFVLVAEQAG